MCADHERGQTMSRVKAIGFMLIRSVSPYTFDIFDDELGSPFVVPLQVSKTPRSGEYLVCFSFVARVPCNGHLILRMGWDISADRLVCHQRKTEFHRGLCLHDDGAVTQKMQSVLVLGSKIGNGRCIIVSSLRMR